MMRRPLLCLCSVSVLLLAAFHVPAPANGQWPTWRGSAQRTGFISASLPEHLRRQWTLQLAEPRPAWPAEQGKVQFDASYEPVAVDGRLFVPSMVRDCVTAHDAATGRRLWRFYTNGPVRFAPLVDRQRVYFVADDGHLYCVRVEDGELIWKVRGGPDDRRVLGNDRLISMWPARGAPVLYEGTIYFAAGIWPFMGIFIHAIDAESGAVVWTNSGSGSNYLVQQHNSPAFAGVAPQGYLVATEDVLLVSGGMTVPAAYNRHTGEFLYFRPDVRTLGKDAGGYEVVAGNGWFANRGIAYRLADGEILDRFAPSVMTDDLAIVLEGPSSVAGYESAPRVEQVTETDRQGKMKTVTKARFAPRWTAALPEDIQAEALHVLAGRRIFAAGADGALFAFDLPEAAGGAIQLAWRERVDGHVWRMLTDGQRLFVVTREGSIHCFADARPAPDEAVPNGVVFGENATGAFALESDNTAAPRGAATGEASLADGLATVLGELAAGPGYGIVLGARDMQLIDLLVKRTAQHVIAIDTDAAACDAARRVLDGAGLLGTRVAVVHRAIGEDAPATGEPILEGLPPYMAQWVIRTAELPADESHAVAPVDPRLAPWFRPLRPYGGAAVFPLGDAASDEVYATAAARLPGAEFQRRGEWGVLRRKGALPGSAPWTHQNGDVANTLVSRDTLVKVPLGLLWFGGPSNRDVLPRHGHGPAPQVVGGRLFIEGPDMLRAVDVYTGQLLWQRELPEIGLYYDNTGHHPGAGAIGGNYVSVADGIYVAYGRAGLRLDPATGETLATLTLPPDESGERPVWGYIGVYEDVLLVGSSPIAPLSRSRAGDAESAVYTRFGEGSRRLVALNRHTGDVLWTRDADFNFRHNAICAGDGRVYCLDRITDARREYLRRRGRELSGGARLLALDARSGEVLWQHDEDAFGTWLSYSEDHGVLLQAGSAYRDRAVDETGRGMAVYRGDSGEIVWRSDDIYPGPPLLLGDQIVTQGTAVDLLTGERMERRDPLTGESKGWNFTRNYGCNTAIGCPNLLTFRSAAAGYFDLASDGGTGNLGGFRSSCTSNLIPADGVLNAPDYTRTCTCSYQNQCSLALVPMPDVEMWTFNSARWSGQRVQRVGINFGAPGDRRAEDGVLWLDYPSVGGSSPDLPIELQGEGLCYHRSHAAVVHATGYPWVQASGVSGATSIRVTVVGDGEDGDGEGAVSPPRPYTVRLYFADPEALPAGERVFDVALQDREVLSGLDIARSVRAGETGIVREFRGVLVDRHLKIDLRPVRGQPVLSGLELRLED